MFFSAFGSSSSAHDAGHPRSQRPTAKSTDNDFARGRVIKWQRDAIICETVTPRPSVNRLILRPFASFATFCSNPLCFPSVGKSSLPTVMTLDGITRFLENTAIRIIRGVAIRSDVSRRTSLSIIVATIALAAILLCQLPGQPAPVAETPTQSQLQTQFDQAKAVLGAAAEKSRERADAAKKAMKIASDIAWLAFGAGKYEEAANWFAKSATGADVMDVVQPPDEEKSHQGMLAFGNPTGADLPSAETEVQAIAKFFPETEVLLGVQATKAALSAGQRLNNRVVHFA